MTDLLTSDTKDVQISDDDLLIGFSDQQQQERLLLTDKGEIKQFIDAGVGVVKFLESESPALLIREIGMQFTADGMNVKSISMDSNDKISINAPYEGS